MIGIFDLFTLAIMFCILGYFIGVALRAIPSRRMHEYGTLMMEDSFLTAILIAIATKGRELIGYIAENFLWRKVGTYTPSFELFSKWITVNIGILVGIIASVATVAAVFSFLSSLIGGMVLPFMALLVTTLFQFFILKLIGDFLSKYYMLLIAIGVVIYSIPRVGKMLGAGLIAFTLVFYLGLPLMPICVEWMKSTFGTVAINTEVPIINEIINAVQTHVIPLFFFPLLYVSILNGMVAGLARALGGMELRIPGL